MLPLLMLKIVKHFLDLYVMNLLILCSLKHQWRSVFTSIKAPVMILS
jgi:hypothetical protein